MRILHRQTNTIVPTFAVVEGRHPSDLELSTLMRIEKIATMPGELSPYPEGSCRTSVYLR